MLSACTSEPLLEGLNLIEKRWKRDTSYMSLDPRYDSLWNETGQSALIFDDQGSVVQITMFHQLHCLASLRKALQEASNGQDIGIDHTANTHWPHCMHFLREAVICSADGTLERPGYYPNGTGQTFINGYGDIRYCRSSEELYRLRETNRLYTSSGVLASYT
ncbi:hypothetical protein BO79DRAFT_146831 [Aspergillus costaricaensis CBS 115574]|uniref:Uncharacterized protein n=1 Tax=Aspergillus costaricaensis CBS 115574 TaxID=1448317 RepID=A0ACD1IGL4_9EURO|nr:hypothetical protein BO79DRAFT_146831 [Aspergillus costaricaensis CBS 115574]RAK89241.1 hypothetical protein BO79DRAFT_146831 [Aspergillus costaricaensis CBS 115574]